MPDEDVIVAITAILSCTCAAVAAIGSDGRQDKAPKSEIKSIRNNVWQGDKVESSGKPILINETGVLTCESDGWHKRNLRVSRITFEKIVSICATFAFENGIKTPGQNAFVDMSMRVAMTLAYLANEGGFSSVSALFGISKSTAIVSINDVCIRSHRKLDMHQFNLDSGHGYINRIGACCDQASEI